MQVIRRLAERVARGKCLRRRFSLNGKKISLLVTPDSQLKYLRMKFDQDLIELAKNNVKRGDVVWDVGANCGVFTFAAAEQTQTGPVVSIEPDIWLANMIKRSTRFRSNRQKDIRVLPIAISDSEGIFEFVVAGRGRASSHLSNVQGRSHVGGTRFTDHVPAFSLDQLLNHFPRPNFVKIDIEGAELLALQGATKLVSEVRPAVYIEVGEDSELPIRDLFRDNAYEADVRGANILFRPK